MTFPTQKVVIISFFHTVSWAPLSLSSHVFFISPPSLLFFSSYTPYSWSHQSLWHTSNSLLSSDWQYSLAVPSVLRLCLTPLGRNRKPGDRLIGSLKKARCLIGLTQENSFCQLCFAKGMALEKIKCTFPLHPSSCHPWLVLFYTDEQRWKERLFNRSPLANPWTTWVTLRAHYHRNINKL